MARAAQAFALLRAFAELEAFSMIARRDTTLSIHRLVQIVVQHGLQPEEAEQWMGTAVSLLTTAYPSPRLDNWETCGQLAPHVVAASRHATEHAVADAGWLATLDRTSTYFALRGLYTDARLVILRSIAGTRRRGELQTLAGADRVAALGGVYLELGMDGKAERYLRRAHEMTIRMAGLEPSASNGPLARRYRALGQVCYQRGDHREALKMQTSALKLWAHHEPEGAEDIATLEAEVAETCRLLGRYDAGAFPVCSYASERIVITGATSSSGRCDDGQGERGRARRVAI
jgi:hypothetical protein